MIKELRITVLVENTVRSSGLLGEHGLAFWIEADGRRILFDTGQGKVLCHNSQCLEVPLPTAEMIAISHGHYDHTGGLNDALGEGGQTDLYLHPAALGTKYYKEQTPPHRDIGIPFLDEQALRDRARKLVLVTEPTELIEGVHLTGEIPRLNDFEDTGGPFYLDRSCAKRDPLLDDQAIYIETSAGIVVVLGCAHSGVVNTLDYVSELTGQDQIFAVLGGMHLVHASPQRLIATVEALKRYVIRKIGAAHCTGMKAASHLWSQLPEECFECCVGTEFSPW